MLFKTKLNDLPISIRLNVLLGGFVTLMIAALAVYSYQTHRDRINRSEQQLANNRINTLASIVEHEVNTNIKHLERSIAVAWQQLDNTGTLKENNSRTTSLIITDQQTNAQSTIELPEWKLGNQTLLHNNTLVDEINRLTHASATVFQKTAHGFVRIATTVSRSDGSRATDTYINYDSPVAQSVNSGTRFNGRAIVMNQWYRTIYDPIYVDGEVKGMLYIGLPEKDLSSLQKLMTEFGADGSQPFILDQAGDLILSGTQQDIQPLIAEVNRLTGNEARRDTISNNGNWLYFKSMPEVGLKIAIRSDVNSINKELRSLLLKILLSVFIAIPAFIVLLTLLNRGIIQGIQQATVFAAEVAQGQLTGRIAMNRQDEVGQLAQSLDNMVVKLRDIVTNVSGNADAVVNLGGQLNSASLQMSEGANVQASAAEEVSSSMQEMAANIMQNSDNAQSTGHSVAQVVKAVDESARLTVDAAEIMEDVSRKASVIGDIARQTNILALNAAVEAARAGDAGRGFAVVAAEVRKLAERSRMDAETIAEAIARGTTLTQQAGEHLTQILPALNTSNHKVQEIVAAGQEQAIGADQVNSALVELNRITQQNAAISEEVASGTTDMNHIAIELKQTIGFFKI